mgnify:CR=1 FL=1
MIIKDEDRLRLPCEEVLPGEVDNLRAKLEQELKKSARRGRPGMGLAAPQIGIQKRMAIVRIKATNGKSYNLDLINPNIYITNDLVTFDEGCLSFPGQSILTRRYNEIVVETGLEESRESVAATGLIAVCIQHETDHLDGILMMDRAVKGK